MLLALVLVTAVAVALIVKVCQLRSQNQRLNGRVEQFESTYRWLVGSGPHGSYRFVSVDGGKHWHTVSQEDGGFVVTGTADQEYVSRVLGMQELAAHVQAHGPIDPDDPDGMSLLERAGFKVVREGAS